MNEPLVPQYTFDIKTKNNGEVNNTSSNLIKNNLNLNIFNINNINSKLNSIINSNTLIEREDSYSSSRNGHTELYFLILNAISMIVNGLNHFDFKFLQLCIGQENYNIFPFFIWRSIFIIVLNYFRMIYENETINPFKELYHNSWFWIRNFSQFISTLGMLTIIIYFRVATATCFVSMAPIIIVIMSSILLKEKFYMRYIYGTLICFIGVLFILYKEYTKAEDTNLSSGIKNFCLGFMWGIIELLSVAFHKVSSKVLVKQKISMNVQYMYPSLTCIICSIICLLLGNLEFKINIVLIFHSFINSIIWLVSTITMLMSYKGVDLIKTTALGYLGPVTVFILGALFLHQTVYPTDIIGSLIILGYNVYSTAYPPDK